MAGTRRAVSKERKRDAKRKLILDTAAQLFFERGIAGTTMDAICEMLGVTKPFVYYYFKDKQKILEAVSMDAASVTLSSLRVGAAGKATVAQRIRGALRELLVNHVRLFAAGTLYLREPHAFSPQFRTKMRELARRFRNDLIGLLDEGIEAGILPPQDTGLTAAAIGGIVGFMYTWYAPSGPLGPDEMVDSLLKVILRTAGFKEDAATSADGARQTKVTRKQVPRRAPQQTGYARDRD